MSAGWIIGFSIGAAVVVVVVVLLLLMIIGARRIARRAEAILEALYVARENTLGLWQAQHTNSTARRIVTAATSAREALASKGAIR